MRERKRHQKEKKKSQKQKLIAKSQLKSQNTF